MKSFDFLLNWVGREEIDRLRFNQASGRLEHIVNEAKQRGYQRLSLETGSFEFFQPARKLYSKFGFQPCEPFADYKEDPNSVFMTIKVQ